MPDSSILTDPPRPLGRNQRHRGRLDSLPDYGRWTGRLALERETVTLSHLAVAVRALAQLDDDPGPARRALMEIARQHDLAGVDRLLGAARNRPSSAAR